MTANIQRPLHHMSAQAGIHFRDPFVSHDRRYNTSPVSQPAYAHRAPLSRTLTPPPDMRSLTYQPPSRSSHHLHHHQEHGQVHGEHYSTAPHGYGAPSYHPRDTSNGHGSITENRLPSPIPSVRQPVFDETQSTSRRGSQANTIAPSFRIPKSVNDSGGSLSELAAEITCLFWFEPADVLQLVEDSPTHAVPLRQLCADARPSTGFRKWVTTILSTTCVAQNVVLLALLFIYRLKKLNPAVRGKPGSEYRLLTVALMLGNKFLDDNTYTNKTWAEVSGIMVSEVHIMEVEFLSNMKYCLFTSAEDWTKWQTLLGKFAAFVDRSKAPPARSQPAPILPPASSLHLPMALPSPPASNHASPPFGVESNVHGSVAPSPLVPLPDPVTLSQASRKRSLDTYSTEPPAKRLASFASRVSPQRPISSVQHNMPRLPLPNLVIPAAQNAAHNYAAPTMSAEHPTGTSSATGSFGPRSMAMVYPAAGSHGSIAGSQHPSRQQSPYPGSAAASPTSAAPPATNTLQPTAQISPSYFLQQRNSPYRPVHNVSTLLYPPPSGALQQAPQKVEYQQMHYQPLGKPMQHRQTGRLPYVSQNMWLDGNQPQSMTPVHQWSGFSSLAPTQGSHPPPPHHMMSQR